MDKKTFSFELVDKYTPETVIRNSLKQMEEATDGHVLGKIEEYQGPICSYTKKGVLGTLSEPEEVNIQDALGEQNDERNRYEVYLTVKGLEHYKYRMMFVDYGAISYPVTIVMNETLAREYNGGRLQEKFLVKSMKDLEDMLSTIFESKAMLSLLQSLINESLRQEANSL
ncbi:MAG: hypothetical protein HFG41_13190 [Coprococcus sp.]|nr:hypothetical protein [Coprococcus sp.]